MSARLGILLSGRGSTYDNLVAQIAAGRLDAEIALVVSSRRSAGGLARAAAHGHPTAVLREADAIDQAFAASGAELIAMCGWMRYWDPPPRWHERVVNVHPSLLPSFAGKGFYGHHVHEAVLAHGCKLTGCSVHLVQGDYDTGPLLAQRAVPVHSDDDPDSLAARVQQAERDLYPAVIQALITGRMRRQGRHYWIDDPDPAPTDS